MSKIILFTLLVFYTLSSNGQNKLTALIENDSFTWNVVSPKNNLFIYYEKDSFAEEQDSLLTEEILQHIENTCEFLGIKEYNQDIHYFIVENRGRMSLLVGYETNGGAYYVENYLTAIYSKDLNSVSSNHELFHLIAMNLWGKPDNWFNEGMAVYADNTWYGYGLHELAKYLIDNDRFISLKKLKKKLRKYDSMITYPLLGSYAKYIDEKYGRDVTINIWNNNKKAIKKSTGKRFGDLEQEWLDILTSTEYENIDYLNLKN